MKVLIYSAEEVNKNFEFNQNQTEVGSKLKTYKGSAIQRASKYGVGKLIGGEIYFHKDYAKKIIPYNILSDCESCLQLYAPDFSYNCMKYNPKTNVVSFQEGPDFDTAREPKVGDYFTVYWQEGKDPGEYKYRRGHSDYIWHSKWLWVDNNYKGFNVKDSWEWSKKWLSTIKEKSDGNGIERWNAQLDKYGLPHDN